MDNASTVTAYDIEYKPGVTVGDQLDKFFILANQQLPFEGLSAVISDSRIHSSTKCILWFTDATRPVAYKAGVKGQAQEGQIVFTATKLPSGPIICDITCVNN